MNWTFLLWPFIAQSQIKLMCLKQLDCGNYNSKYQYLKWNTKMGNIPKLSWIFLTELTLLTFNKGYNLVEYLMEIMFESKLRKMFNMLTNTSREIWKISVLKSLSISWSCLFCYCVLYTKYCLSKIILTTDNRQTILKDND